MKLETNHRKRNEKKTDYNKTKQHILKNQWVNEEIKRKIKKYLKTNDNEKNNSKSYMPKKQCLEGSS